MVVARSRFTFGLSGDCTILTADSADFAFQPQGRTTIHNSRRDVTVQICISQMHTGRVGDRRERTQPERYFIFAGAAAIKTQRSQTSGAG